MVGLSKSHPLIFEEVKFHLCCKKDPRITSEAPPKPHGAFSPIEKIGNKLNFMDEEGSRRQRKSHLYLSLLWCSKHSRCLCWLVILWFPLWFAAWGSLGNLCLQESYELSTPRPTVPMHLAGFPWQSPALGKRRSKRCRIMSTRIVIC